MLDTFPDPLVDAPLADETAVATAVLAGGCFWCTEAVYEQLPGVSDVESGYVGGDAADANYEAVCRGDTGHAEAIRITYDPSAITFGQILKTFFFIAHDPTTLNRQGNDHGTQYRSAVFPLGEEQQRIATAYIEQLNRDKAFPRPVVTTIEELSEFHPAETYHQDFVQHNPGHPYIVSQALPKIAKLRKSL